MAGSKKRPKTGWERIGDGKNSGRGGGEVLGASLLLVPVLILLDLYEMNNASTTYSCCL